MLTPQQLLAATPKRRPLRSLRQQYELYIMDRIDHYKESLPRGELMRLADAAMVELRGPEESQFILTEVLAQEAVDELVKRRLGIRSFESWRKSYPKRRAAQRNPAHWGLDEDHLMGALVPRVEPDDAALVVGRGAEACAYLLAAHDAIVTFLDQNVGVVERAEQRVADEALSSTCFEAICLQFGAWLPDTPRSYALVVIDTGTLTALSPGARRVLIADLQRLTQPGGLHALVPDGQGSGPEGLAGHYAAWHREPLPGRRSRSARGALFLRSAEAECARDEEHASA